MNISFDNGQSTTYFNAYNLFGPAAGYTIHLVGTVNWGLPPTTRITQRGPFQDGDTDIDYRINPRIFSLPIVIEANTIDEHMNARNMLMKVFPPTNRIQNLLIDWDSETQRRIIEVRVVGGLSLDTDARDFNVRTVVQLRAADPTWSDSIQFEQVLTYTIFGTPTPYPKPYPVPYGAAGVNNIFNFYYDGSWISRPILVCDGPLSDLTITDTKGNIIRFSDTIPAFNRVIIDLKSGNPTVTLNDDTNAFGMLAIESNLVNWALYPVPDAADIDGLNVISVSATGADGNSRVTMQYITRYIGV